MTIKRKVYNSFEDAIDNNNISPDYQFYSLNIHSIEDVVIEDDKIKRLKELDNLRKSGILTNQEFEKLKSDLMN